MRGKPDATVEHAKMMRNIPAYAGKTHTAMMQAKDAAEHPRVCGENLTTPKLFGASTGTSPRMRGKPGCQL